MANSFSQLQSSIPVITEYAKFLSTARGCISDQVAPPLRPQVFNAAAQPNFLEAYVEIWTNYGTYLPKDTIRANGMEANRLRSAAVGTRSVECFPHALKDLITEADLNLRRQSGVGAADKYLKAKARQLYDALRMEREVAVASYVTTYTNYDSSSLYATLSSGSRWNEVNGDPLGNFITAFQAVQNMGCLVTDIAMDSAVWQALSIHDQLTKLLKVSDGLVSRPVLEGYLTTIAGNPVKIHVNWSRYDSSGTMTSPWSDYVVFYSSGQQMLPPEKRSDGDIPFADMADDEFPASFRTVMPAPMSYKIIDKPELDHNGAYELEAQVSYGVTSALIDNTTDKKFIGAYLLIDTLA